MSAYPYRMSLVLGNTVGLTTRSLRSLEFTEDTEIGNWSIGCLIMFSVCSLAERVVKFRIKDCFNG